MTLIAHGGLQRGLIRMAIVVAGVSAAWAPMPVTAQTVVGAIAGTVQDASGAVLPGVTVSLTNEGLIGGNQETVTDARGAYEFARLVPSPRYSVRAELQGFRSATYDSVAVNANVTTRVDLTLVIGDVAETVTVSGAAPLIDTASAVNQTVMTADVIDTLPTAGDLWALARTVTGIVLPRYDVGGSASGQTASASVHGSASSESSYVLDGADSPLGYLSTSNFQEVNFMTGNTPAEFDRGGVVYNLVTRTGGNEYRSAFQIVGSNSALQSQNMSPALRGDLLAAVPPAALAANPDLVPAQKVLKFIDTTGHVSGPLLSQRLWFAGSYSWKAIDDYQLGYYDADGTQFIQDLRQSNIGVKLSWEATPNHRLHYTLFRSSKPNYHKRDVDQAQAFIEQRATYFDDVSIPVDIINYTGILSPRLVVEVTGAYSRFNAAKRPQAEVRPGDIPQYDSTTLTLSCCRESYVDQQWRIPHLNARATFSAGNHDLKFGYQPMLRKYREAVYSTSHQPAGLRAVFTNGVPSSVNTYNSPFEFTSYSMTHGVYIQDRWQVTRQLTLNAGVRLEKSNGWLPAVCQEQTIFVDAQCFDELRDIPNWFNVAPRFGLIYDVTGNGKTVLKVGANRYLLNDGFNIPNRVNPVSGGLRPKQDSRTWTDRNNDRVPQIDELGASTGFNLGTTNRYDTGLQQPYTVELSAEIEQQLPANVAVSLAYYHRSSRNNIGSRNLLVPRESYVPLQVVEATSGVPVTVYNQDPATRGRFDVLFDNASELDGEFNGVDASVTKRLSQRWMLMGGVSVGRSVGDTYGTADLNNPNNVYRRGVLANDVPLSFKISGIYELPYGLSASANVQHFAGFPEADTVLVSRNTTALTQVSQVVRVTEPGANRLPSVNMVDVALRKTWRRGKLAVEPVIEAFNLGNTSVVTSRSTLLGPTYHRVTGIVNPRMVRLGIDLRY